MNPELVKQALEKVTNPHVLVNMVSRRVRQLNSGGSGMGPLVTDVGNLGGADIALREIIEDKMSFEMPEIVELNRPSQQNGRRPSGWTRLPTPTANGAKEKE